jgi:hypothetical protein
MVSKEAARSVIWPKKECGGGQHQVPLFAAIKILLIPQMHL